MYPSTALYARLLILCCLVSTLQAQQLGLYASVEARNTPYISSVHAHTASAEKIFGVQDWQKVTLCTQETYLDGLSFSGEISCMVSSIDPDRATENALIQLKRKAAYVGASHIHITDQRQIRKVENPSANGTFYTVVMVGLAYSLEK